MEKKITLTIAEDGSINVEYPTNISYMETVGILEAGKAILLNEYVNPKKMTYYNSTTEGGFLHNNSGSSGNI